MVLVLFELKFFLKSCIVNAMSVSCKRLHKRSEYVVPEERGIREGERYE